MCGREVAKLESGCERMAELFKASYYTFMVNVKRKGRVLAYNTMSGALLELDEHEASVLRVLRKRDIITTSDLVGHDYDFIKGLIEAGILIPNYVDEKDVIRERIAVSRQAEYRKAKIMLTLAPTVSCNMGCAYCFEGPKPVSRFMSEETMQDLIAFLDRAVLEKKHVHDIHKLGVCWYGGEPLLRPELIGKLSPQLIEFADRNELAYEANIISNGLNLDATTWRLLQREKVSDVQVTIDGYKEAHNQSRPLLATYGDNSVGNNYDRIIDNIGLKPPGMRVSIRINTDRAVFESLPRLLEDLENRGIWPQQAHEVFVYMAYKHPPRSTSNVQYSTEGFYSKRQFYKAKDEFRKVMLQRYNRWAVETGAKRARRKIQMPEKATSFLCSAASLPYSITLDPDGYIHQCWEHVNDPSTRSSHLRDDFVLDHPGKHQFLEWKKFDHPVCNKCKLFPVCDATCPIEEPPELCIDWKFRIRDRLRDDYLALSSDDHQLETYSEARGRLSASG